MRPKAVAGISLRQKRKPSPFPKPAPGDWPLPWEPVDLHWAKFALRFGNAAVLARYLREAKEVDQFILRSVRRLLEAKQGPRLQLHRRTRGRPGPRPPLICLGPAELADLLAPLSDSRGCYLEFIGPDGSPGKPNKFWRDHALYTKVRFARAREGKTYLAVENVVMPETKLGRATIYKALRANKPRSKN
jgi:hypothetical protein